MEVSAGFLVLEKPRQKYLGWKMSLRSGNSTVPSWTKITDVRRNKLFHLERDSMGIDEKAFQTSFAGLFKMASNNPFLFVLFHDL